MNTYRITDLFTSTEIDHAAKIWRKNPTGCNAALVLMINPLLPRIQERTGQENSASYLAYMLEYVFISSGMSEHLP